MVEVIIIKGRGWIDFEKSRIYRLLTDIAGKGEREVWDETRVWSPRDYNNSVAMERKENLEFQKKEEFSLWFIEVKKLAKSELKMLSMQEIS